MQKERLLTTELTLLHEIQQWLEAYRDATDVAIGSVMIDEALDAAEDLLECIKQKTNNRRLAYEAVGSSG